MTERAEDIAADLDPPASIAIDIDEFRRRIDAACTSLPGPRDDDSEAE